MRNTLVHNEIYGASNGSSADNIQIAGYTNGSTIAYNTLFDGRGTVITNDAADVHIHHNLMRSRNYAPTLLVSVGDPGGLVEVYNNNLIHDATDATTLAAIRIILTDPAGIKLKNNIIYGATRCVWQSGGVLDEVDLDYNDYYTYGGGTMITWNGLHYTAAQFADYQAASSKDANSFYGNPLLGADYYTLARNSPCINRGTNVGLLLDFLGTIIPIGSLPDIGILESSLLPAPAAEPKFTDFDMIFILRMRGGMGGGSGSGGSTRPQ